MKEMKKIDKSEKITENEQNEGKLDQVKENERNQK